MHRELEKELKDLAKEILQLNDFNEVDHLREKAHKLYEQLLAISFLNKHFDELKRISLSNSLAINKLNDTLNEVQELKVEDHQTSTVNPTELFEEIVEDKNLNTIFEPKFDSVKEDFSQKEEFKDTVSLDETEKLFETKKLEEKQLSLHDKFLRNSIQVGLNDRIAFVNNLFNFSQTEFNKTLSILNECKTKNEAINYFHQTVKTKYNWQGKEELEERFLVIIERKFI